MHPLDAHLAALHNPALNARQLGVAESQAPYRARAQGTAGRLQDSRLRLWMTPGAKIALAPFYAAAYLVAGCRLRHEKPNRRLEFVRIATHNVACSGKCEVREASDV